MRRWPLTAVVVCLLCSPLLAQGTFALEYKQAAGDEAPAVKQASRAFRGQPTKPDEITGLPADLPGDVRYFSSTFGGRKVWVIACAGSPPRIYLDTDRDNDFSDEKPVAGTVRGSGVSFGTVAAPLQETGTIPVAVMSHSGADGKAPGCLHLEATGYRAGEVRLGGRTYRVALVDHDLNGRYDDVLSGPFPRSEMDALIIDLNGDGRFADIGEAGNVQEWMPLSKARQVDGTYYRIQVPADGSQIQLEKTEPQFGNLDFGRMPVRFDAYSDFGYLTVDAADGKARVPAGLCAPCGLIVTYTDDAGTRWTLQRSNDDERLGTFTVPADQTLSIPLGPPLVAKAEVEQEGASVLISAVLVGKSGERYVPAVRKTGTQVQPPSLEIVDRSGKVLLSAQFEYG